jgi:ParB family chromosome partitioning protein
MAAAVRDAGRANAEIGGHLGVDELATLELAVEMKALRDAQLDLRMVDLEQIAESHLQRDRTGIDPDALEELKTSIRDQGLALPIRVDLLDDGRYGLNQGRRRLLAFRALYAETGDPRYARIPALVDKAGERESAYRRMVDENLIREDVSLGELAGLAISYAEETSIAPDVAVERLFASAHRNRRWTIREFVKLLAAIGDVLHHPKAISRDLGRKLARKIDGGEAQSIRSALDAAPDRSEADEVAILEAVSSSQKARRAPRTRPAVAPARKFRVTPKHGKGRRYDVSVTEKKIVISGKDVGTIGDDRIRELIEKLVGE